MKILDFPHENHETWKILEFHMRIRTLWKSYNIIGNNENNENHIIPKDNYETNENHRIPCNNYENH